MGKKDPKRGEHMLLSLEWKAEYVGEKRNLRPEVKNNASHATVGASFHSPELL